MMHMYCSLVFSNDGDVINYSLADHYEKICGFAVRTCENRSKDVVIMHFIKGYMMLCVSVIFDSAGFYIQHHNYKRKVKGILLSKEVDNLLRCLTGFSQRPDVQEMLALAEKRRSELAG